MADITREAILAGEGRMQMHLNYGGGKGGYSYQHQTFRRLSWIDKHGRWPKGRPPREWYVDGAMVGEGDRGRAIFGPHFDVDLLWEVCGIEHEDVREAPHA